MPADLRTALRFARSVIKSGESWSDDCERMIDDALYGADPPIPGSGRYIRGEDMSASGYLELFKEGDGDVIVRVCAPDRSGVLHGQQVQFCTLHGGGRSSNTLRALWNLIAAMEADNRERPDPRHKRS